MRKLVSSNNTGVVNVLLMCCEEYEEASVILVCQFQGGCIVHCGRNMAEIFFKKALLYYYLLVGN